MADSPTSNRPRQVTVGAWVSGAASLAMLLSVGSILAKLHTVDLRQSVTEFLTSGNGRSLGVGVDQALSVARVGLMVLGGVSAAMLVFAFFAARRDKGSRIAMSVLAAPLVVCGLFVDVFLTGFIVAATILLWTEPARDWYAGRAPRPAPQVERPAEPTPSIDQAQPPYVAGYGEPGVAAPTAGVTSRPRQVVAACITTWALSTLVAGFLVTVVFSLGSDEVRTQFRDALQANPQARELGITIQDLTTASAVICVLMAVWSLAASATAVLVWRRQGWARVVLVVSAVAAGGLALLCSIAFPGFLLVAAGCGMSVAMLLHRDTTTWLSRTGSSDESGTDPTK